MREINEIIIHCSATREGVYYNARNIDEWHKALGWKKIGYHYVVLLDGKVEKGREEEVIGAHCFGHNEESIGICYVGGLDSFRNAKDTRTPQQKIALRELLYELKNKYKDAKIIGHRDTGTQKDCPCFDTINEYKNL